MNNFFSLIFGVIQISLYLELAFMNLSMWWLAIKSTMRSMQGSRKMSFKKALFKSMKLTHILHLPFGFFTSTTSDNQSG